MTNLSDFVGNLDGDTSGSFLPSWQNGSSLYGTRWGEWYKTGELMVISAYMEWSSLVQNSGEVRIFGYPEHPASGTEYTGSLCRIAGGDFGGTIGSYPTQLGIKISSFGYTELYLSHSIGNAVLAGQAGKMTYNNLATSGLIQFNGTFKVA